MILRGSFYSQALGRQTNITLVGPDVWPQAGACKTAYVLHGMEGNQDTWADNSLLPLYAAKGNTLYVLPDGGRSFYRNMPQGPRYFTYLSQELPQMVRQRFQVSPIREDTAVLGCSMGGYGALLCALGCPERFGLCAAFAPACLFAGEALALADSPAPPSSFAAAWARRRRDDLHHAFGDGTASSDLIGQAAALPAALRPQLYLACGSRDPFLPDLRRFAAALQALGWAATAEEWEGIHDYCFFDAALARAIRRFRL